MTGPPPVRRAAPLLLAALAACGGNKMPCLFPSPQPSALPTLPAAAAAGQSQAIHFGAKTTGQVVSFTVPDGTASVTIVEQAASRAVPTTVSAGGVLADNTAVPFEIRVAGTPIFVDYPMPPDSAFRQVPPSTGLTVLDPASDPSLAAYFFSAGPWTGALTLPNTSVAIPGTVAPAGVPAGTWTVTVGDWAYECSTIPALGCAASSAAPSSYDVTVILKPVAAPASSLRVVFYLATWKDLAAAAPSDPDFRRLEWAVSRILGQAGITPSFQYRDAPPEVRLRAWAGVNANSGGVCGDVDQLLVHAEPGNQLNVFLVERIRDSLTGGYTTVGLDPIVPGPASFGGTPASGVLVSVENLGRVRTGSVGCPKDALGNDVLSIGTCGDDATAAVVAHEAGHFLGLYHDTESIGTVLDPIADTASCLCPVCKPAGSAQKCQGVGGADPAVADPYQMLVSDCLGATSGCGGGDNLMFWLLARDSKGLLTPGQAAVMRANPLVE